MADSNDRQHHAQLEKELSEQRQEVKALRKELREARAEALSNKLNLEALSNASRHHLMIIDTDGHIEAINHTLAAAFGMTPQSLIGMNISRFIDDDLFKARMKQVQTVLETRRPVIFSDTNGGARLTHCLYPVMENEDVVRIAVCTEDVSKDMLKDAELIRSCADQVARNVEQLQYEELLRFSRDIYQNIPSGVFIYQYKAPDSLIMVDANPAAEMATGVFLKEHRGKEFDAIWPQARELGIAEQFLKAMRTGEPYSSDDFIYDGKTLYGEYQIKTFLLPGDRLGVTFEDITEYKKAGIAIRESEEYYRAFFEDNHSVMLIIEPESGQIMMSNRAAEQYYGYTRQQLMKMSAFDLNTLPPVEVDSIISSVANKRRRHFICQHKLASGEKRDVEIFSGPFDSGGQTKLISIVHDITDRLKAERLLSEAKETAEQANKTKDEFLANISHEVRTPLNGVMGMLQLMLETRLNEEQMNYVSTALRSSRNLLRVLNDVLDFTKMEAGKFELYHEPFDLDTLLAESLELFRQQAETVGLQLAWQIYEGTPKHFMGDEGRIRQVLFNLIGNAIKFTNAGNVSIEAFSLPHKSSGKIRLFFTVEDSGIGIPDEKIDYIFESFSQVGGSLSRKHQGTGLGLPIVKRLVGLMDGHISVDTQLGVGTKLTFFITVEPATVPAKPVLHHTNNMSATGKSILLAEDEKVNRIMAKRLLEKMGHTVDCAENGAACLDLLRRNNYDIVLMDIQMPYVNGLEATHAIRNDEDFRHVRNIPIIALTAHAAKHDLEAAIRMGMNEYISKPFELKELKRAIATLTQ